jgi:hypothetical protein
MTPGSPWFIVDAMDHKIKQDGDVELGYDHETSGVLAPEG